jgi:nucleoside-diphosphate-sugar epimerase
MARTISILGCGWLGRPLGARLARSGVSVRGSTTTPDKQEALRADGIEPHLLTLGPEVTSDTAGTFFTADVLVLNVPPPRGRDDRAAYHQTQVHSTVEAAAAQGVSWVVFATSTGVYPERGGVVREDDAPPGPTDDPLRPTGKVLRRLEGDLLEDAPLDVTVVRLAGLYGGDRHPGRFLAGRSGVSGADAPVNLVHREDAIGVIGAVLRRDARNTVVNACANAHPTRQHFYTHAARTLGLDPPQFAEGTRRGKVVSNRRARRVLGYRFRHPDPMDLPTDAP